MPNQPAAGSKGIYIRVHEDIKQAIQNDCDRINSIVPGANVTITSWIRTAIETQLKGIKEKA